MRPAVFKHVAERVPTALPHVLFVLVFAEKQKVAVIVDAVSTKAAEIAAVKDDAERDLAVAKPALEEALAALNSISPKDITSLKALKSPPDIIKRIFDCVLLLRYWPVGEKVSDRHHGVDCGLLFVLTLPIFMRG